MNSNMVFINNSNDVTLAPPNSMAQGMQATLQANARGASGMSFDQARAANRIYANNGYPCQQAMCNSMYGCDNLNSCMQKSGFKDILGFCGMGTTGRDMDGSYWTLQPANEQQQLMTATKQALGVKVLPNPYNQVGMY